MNQISVLLSRFGIFVASMVLLLGHGFAAANTSTLTTQLSAEPLNTEQQIPAPHSSEQKSSEQHSSEQQNSEQKSTVLTAESASVNGETPSITTASAPEIPLSRGKFTEKHLSLHKPNYMLLTWSDKYDGNELVYQISAKFRLFNRDLYAAYTQQSFWQVWNRQNSRPFRETNYQPEVFYRLTPGAHHWEFFDYEFDFVMPFGVDFGYEHQSNGKDLPSSKSWDRLYVEPYYQINSRHYIAMRLWYRIPESPRKDENDVKGDDNPDILDYYGPGYIHYKYHTPRENIGISAKIRGNIDTGRGAIEVDITKPMSVKNVFYVLKLFNGYGDSLIDYNKEVQRVGLGVMMQR